MGRDLSRSTDSSHLNRRAREIRSEEVGGPSNMRSSRHRYTTVACNECKRRKIKCNGLQPCQRCDNLSLDCIFSRPCCSSSTKKSDELSQLKTQVSLLQDQINGLHETFSVRSEPTDYSRDVTNPEATLGSKSRVITTTVSPGRSESDVPRFHGHTSSIYGFDIAKSSLQRMGIMHDVVENAPCPKYRSIGPPTTASLALYLSDDPLWAIGQAEAIRLCKIYDEEIGIMYPHTDMDKVCENVVTLFSCTSISVSLQTGLGQLDFHNSDALVDEDIITVKLVIAIALLLEGNGQSDHSQRLFDSVKDAINSKISGALNIKSLAIFILTSAFHFQRDEEAQSWRFVGIAARMCIEMGLHRKDSLTRSFPDETGCLEAVRVFWVVYALDRRLSFGTGFPFVLQDQDIDTSLPEPDATYPYLKHITELNRITGKIWYKDNAYKLEGRIKRDVIGFLDYQVLQWYAQLPECLTFNKDLLMEQEVPGRGMRRLRFLMYLRKNQARTTIYRVILYSTKNIMENRQYAQNVVDVAKDTIRTISSVNQISDLYRTQQVCYNYFLIQAWGAIFLAVAHAPAEFCEQTRNEFCAVLELIKSLDNNSYVAKRLWRTIRVLRGMGDKLGLISRMDQGADSQNAGGATPDLYNHPIDILSDFEQGYMDNELGYGSESLQLINSELMNLFEHPEEHGDISLPTASGHLAHVGRSGELADIGGCNEESINSIFSNQHDISRNTYSNPD